MRLSPRHETIAFRLWAHCHPLGWNLTLLEACSALNLEFGEVKFVCVRKRWNTRFRPDSYTAPPSYLMDQQSVNPMPHLSNTGEF